jgi:C-terminal processing protease CtpA/Prc
MYSALVLPSRDEEERIIKAQEVRDAARKKISHPISSAPCALDEIQYSVFVTACLPGNIGYLDVHGFIGKEEAADSLASAMNRLKNTRALIIDMRENHGGSGNTSALLASYFFDRPTHLSDVYERQYDHTEQIWTSNEVAGKKYGEKRDVYVLTSTATFSAAEDFSYVMKTFKRATLIGETTEGGAHPTVSGPYRVQDHYTAYIPDARTIGSITKTNWEGIGVIPDISVTTYDALGVAQVLELNKIIRSEKDAKRLAQLHARVSKLKQAMFSHDSIEASR